MSMIVGMVSAAAASGTPPFTQQFLDAASFGGQTPALAILYSGGTGALATATAGLQWQLGAVDAEGNQCAVAIACDSATNPTNTARSNRVDAAYEHITPAGASDGRATAALIADGVELTWSDQSVGESIRALLIGGDVEARIVSLTSNNGTTAQAVTHGLSGPPEVIISIGAFNFANTTDGGDVAPGIGFWAIGSQVGVSTRYRDNVATSAVSGRISTTRIAPSMGVNVDFTYTAAVSNVTNTSFDVTFDAATTHTIHFICLRSTTEEPLDAIAGTFLTKTSTGTQTDITNLSVPPQIIFTVPTRLADVDAGKSDDTGGGFGLGIACRRTGNGDNQYFAVSATGNDGEGAGTAWLNHQRHAGDHIVRLSLAGAVDVRARVSEWNDTNVVHDYQVASATASRVAYLAIGAAGSSVAVPAITSVTTVQVGETFTITGTGFSASGNAVTLGGAEQTITAESETEITCDAVTLGDLRYGSQTIVVTNATAQTASTSVDLLPAATAKYVDVANPYPPENAVNTSPALSAGVQLEYSSVVNGALATTTIGPSGDVETDPTSEAAPVTLQVRAHDGTGWSAAETITLTTGAVAPVFSGTIDDVELDVGDPTVQIVASDYFTDAAEYTLTGTPPAGSAFDTASGRLTIVADAAGVYGPLKITGVNASGSDDSNEFTITVAGPTELAPWWCIFGRRGRAPR